MRPITVGTRGSPLALAQSGQVIAEPTRAWPGREFPLRIIKTKGDRLSAGLLAPDAAPLGKGLFTAELEEALRRGEIDVAVHSLKDLPTTSPADLSIVAIPPRADPRDLLITREAQPLAEWPPGTIVATGSPRRRAQLLLARPDLNIVPVRGNIDTRLRKLRETGEWRGLVLAAAGIDRLGPPCSDLVMTHLPLDLMLPAPGQGALGLQIAEPAEGEIGPILAALHDPATAVQVSAERAFLHALGGGCQQPIAAHGALVGNDELELTGRAWLYAEAQPRQATLRGSRLTPLELGRRFGRGHPMSTPPKIAPGCVYLAGAGPGDPGLVTLRTDELIRRADVILYDHLCNPELLAGAPEKAEKIYVGKSGLHHTLSQTEINALLVARAQAGKCVVRLKGGDPYVFGRGGEEAQVLVAHGVSFEEVPGVSSAIAAPAYAGIPVTHRLFASQVTFVTGHEDPNKPDSSIDWANLAAARGTKVFLMGVERLRALTDNLQRAGADPATPIALIRWGTRAHQTTLRGTLATIADQAEAASFKAPAITIIGGVVGLAEQLNWFERRPLHGQRVVVTRSRAQASRLSQMLRELGADVLEIPTIRMEPAPLTPAQKQVLTKLGDSFDWVVLTSPNGADRFFAELASAMPDWRDLGAIRFAAVGPATAQKVREQHLRVALQPETFTVEHLAEAFSSELVKGARFLLPLGDLAPTWLAEQLRARQGHVEVWTVYRTRPETQDPNGSRARFIQEGADWITFTSSSTVENWQALRLVPAAGAPMPRALSLGPVTSRTLRQNGWEVAAESRASTIDSLIAILRELVVEQA